MLVNLRDAGVPVRKELKEEQMETTVTIKKIRNKVTVTRREEGARTESPFEFMAQRWMLNKMSYQQVHNELCLTPEQEDGQTGGGGVATRRRRSNSGNRSSSSEKEEEEEEEEETGPRAVPTEDDMLVKRKERDGNW